MKLLVKVVMCLTMIVAVLAGEVQASDLPYEEREPDSFRGIAWGTPISNVDGLEFSKEGTNALRELYRRSNPAIAKQVMVYTRPEDDLKIGEAALTRINYYFFKDVFYGMTAYFSGKENYNKLLAACGKKFGEPNFTEDNKVGWRGKQATILLSPSGVLSMDSEEIKDKMEEPEGF